MDVDRCARAVVNMCACVSACCTPWQVAYIPLRPRYTSPYQVGGLALDERGIGALLSLAAAGGLAPLHPLTPLTPPYIPLRPLPSPSIPSHPLTSPYQPELATPSV